MIYQSETERKLYDEKARAFDQLLLANAQQNAYASNPNPIYTGGVLGAASPSYVPPKPMVREFTAVTNTPRAGDSLEQLEARANRGVRSFSTGATRDLDQNKLDFEGFLSPRVLERFAEHMHAARKMPDGTLRDSDNWQKGIPLDAYMKSMFRHFFAVWDSHRGNTGDLEAELCGLLFNVMGYLHETLKAKK